MTIYSIGHSNHPIERFVAHLRQAVVRRLIDVRANPASRFNVQFNAGTLRASLAEVDITYRHMPELGGRRGSIDAASDNRFWPEGALRDYADYAQTAAFASALAELRRLARESPVAIMCAEGDWRRCHRQIITDYLLDAGETVEHILPDGALETAVINPAAAHKAGGGLRYRPHAGDLPLFREA